MSKKRARGWHGTCTEMLQDKNIVCLFIGGSLLKALHYHHRAAVTQGFSRRLRRKERGGVMAKKKIKYTDEQINAVVLTPLEIEQATIFAADDYTKEQLLKCFKIDKLVNQ